MALFSRNSSPTWLLNRLYISTVVAVSMLTITGQVLTQRSLVRQANDAYVVNVAGRQRMLSQKIAKVANGLNAEQIKETQKLGSAASIQTRRDKLKSELSGALSLFTEAHEGLQSGNESLNLPGQNSEQIEQMFAELAPDYMAITTAAETLIQPLANDVSSAAQIISEHESDFLPEMNNIVARYEQEATVRVQQLQMLQKGLLLLTLLALLPVLIPIRQLTRRVDDMIVTMQRSGIQVQSSSLQIAASGKQLEATVVEQAAAGSQITDFSKQIATMANNLTDHVKSVLDQAHTVQETASKGEQELAMMSETMGQLMSMTESITGRLQTISDRSNTIDKVVVAITKVAEQTNLLSLNAAIEAEKAGEYGAGFSVVAREIRRLADQSAIATLEIESMVKEMQASVAVGVVEMEQFTQSVNDSTGRTDRVTRQVISIAQQIQSLLPPLTQMNEGMAFQCMSAEQIRDSLESFSVGSEQTVRALQESNSALDLLKTTAEGLQV